MKRIPLFPNMQRGSNIIVNEYAFVDDEDEPELLRHTWYLKVDNRNDPNKIHYSVGRKPYVSDPNFEKSSLVIMSHHILGIHIKNFKIKYKDGNPLNNQKENLEVDVMDGHELVELRQHWLEQIKPEVQMRMEIPR